MKSSIIKIFTISFLLGCYLFIAKGAQAAILQYEIPKNTVRVGDSVTMKIILNTEGESINTGSITSIIPESLVIQNISTAKSIFKYWVNNPDHPSSNIISFTGGLPNPGFNGTNGIIGEITLKPTKAGKFSLYAERGSQILVNDGFGTSANVQILQNTLLVLDPGKNYSPLPSTKAIDNTPPHDLMLIIGNSQSEFDGKYFASFRAEDDESGIDHYEISEKIKNQNLTNKDPNPNDKSLIWRTATSPYILENQDNNTYVFLKAIDKAGNTSIVWKMHEIKKTPKLPWLIIIILLALLFITYKVGPIWVNKKLKKNS